MSNVIKNNLLQKVIDHTANIGIIGLGYVGLPLMLSFVESGFKVLGFDIDPEKVRKLNQGESYIKHIDVFRVAKARSSGKFEATDNYARAYKMDIIILCVPTPLNRYREPDMSFVLGTIDSLLPYLRRGQLMSLESTTYPGTTDELIKPCIESTCLRVGKDVFLVYSPEREDPGNKSISTRSIPKVLGGTTNDCLEIGLTLYSYVFKRVITVSSTRTAEMTKLLENIYRSVNISLVNELKILADKMGINIWEVIDAASTKPFGFTPFYPGPGWGGHCIPIDPFYLTWKAREYGLQTRFIELAGEVNTSMSEWIMGKLMDAFNERGKVLKGAHVLILGIAYKKNVDDMRESPAVKLMELLKKRGAKISYSDSYVPAFPKMREHSFELQSVELTPELLQIVDCVLIVTDHDIFDYEMILKYARLVLDTRGRYRKENPKVVPC